MSDEENRTSRYWDHYYSDSDVPKIPSQFCVFVANEFPDAGFILELGCGNGRDSLYFAQIGRTVVAIDGSEAAVESCSAAAARREVPATFVQADVTDDGLVETMKGLLPDGDSEILVYARFFLHAINDAAESKLLAALAQLAQVRPCRLCFEFRTERDEALKKETAAHYRRFVKVPELLAKAAEAGFACDYLVEGFGMAKYRHDDAYVARIIFNSSGKSD